MYEQRFYDQIRDGAMRSAATAAPIIVEQLGLDIGDTLLDVGCGEGWWSDAFATLGLDVTGLDSGHTEHRPDSFTFVEHDLGQMLPKGEWDVIICLEVAEHLPHAAANRLIAEMCFRSKCILFSAARPGQGGTGHINERPIGSWAAEFASRQFAVSGALRWHLWGNDMVENWYQQNMLVAIPNTIDSDMPIQRGEALFPPYTHPLMAHPHDVVHPILFEHRRHH